MKGYTNWKKVKKKVFKEGIRGYVSSSIQKERIIEWYTKKGELFLKWVIENYRTHVGEKLNIESKYFRDYLLFLGDPTIEELVVQKGAQIGFTESLIAFCLFLAGYLKLPVGFGFETYLKQRDIVSTRLLPSIRNVFPGRGKGSKEGDLYNKDFITLNGTKITLFFTMTSSRNTTRQAASRLSSFSASAILGDEVELWPLGSFDILKRRMDASCLPNIIFRGGSTPGNEFGYIASFISKADYIFLWTVTCPYCGKEQHITPFGNFLRSIKKKNTEGDEVELFFDSNLRPYSWMWEHKFIKSEIFIYFLLLLDLVPCDSFILKRHSLYKFITFSFQQIAYIGCNHCFGIFDQSILNEGFYSCKKTKIRIKKPQDLPKAKKAAIVLPKIVDKRFSPPDFLYELENGVNKVDIIQQGLGEIQSDLSVKFSDYLFKQATEIRIPNQYILDNKPDLIAMGVDQGLFESYIVIGEYFFFKESLKKEEMFYKSFVRIKEYKRITSLLEIPEICEKYGVLVVGLDCNPDWSLACHLGASYRSKGPKIMKLAFAPPFKITHGPKGGLIIYDEKDILQREQISNKDFLKKFLEPQVYLLDQVNLSYTTYQKTVKNNSNLGIDEVQVFSIDKSFWIDVVYSRFLSKRVWVPKIGLDILSHYMCLEKNEQGRWLKRNPNDHFAIAHSLLEASTYISLFE